MRLALSRSSTTPRWVVALLGCGLLGAVAGLGLRVDVTVEQTLSENWRGLYDILVTAPGQDFGATETQGVVDPNFVATAGEGGISLEQLADIRTISGVEVAAPIGMVGMLRRNYQPPAMWVTDDPASGVTALPTSSFVAQVTVTSSLTLNGQQRVVSQGTGRMWLQTLSETDAAIPAPERLPVSVGFPAAFSPWQLGDVARLVQLGAIPAFASTVVAIDPVAEALLLGESRAAFLDPLTLSPRDRVIDLGDERVGAEWQELMDCDTFYVQCGEIDLAPYAAPSAAPVVPMIVSGEPLHKLALRVNISVAAGDFPTGGFSDIDASVDLLRSLPDEVFHPWRTLEADIRDALLPFSTANLTVLFPGSVFPEGEGPIALKLTSPELRPVLIGRPSYVAVDSSPQGGGVGFSVMPGGVVGAGGLSPAATYEAGSGMDPGVGLVRSYRLVSDPGGVGGVLPAPLGTFTVADISDEASDDVSYVPSGVSGVTSTWRVDESGGLVEVLPNLSGLDFITAAPGAFTDLIGGATLRGSTPIDAVRVRVAGVTDYSQASQQRIMQVAGQIALLGLDVRIVAGSSPQQVSLYVPEYFQEPDGSWSDLGWVFQDWTTLGATATVEAALSGTTVVLVVVALAAGGFGLGVTALTGGLRLRPIVAGLNRIGWRRSYIRRRLAFELAPPYLLLAVTSGLCWWLGPPRLGAVFLAAIGVAVALFATELVSGMRTSRKSFPTGGSSRGSVVLSPEGLAWRLVRGRAWWALLTVVSSVVVAVLAALTIVAVRDGAVRAGATRLATLMVSTTQWLTTGIGVLGVGSAVVLLLLGYRAERAASVGDALVFTRLGFTTGVQRRVAWLQQLFIAAACVATTAVVLTVVSVLFGGGWLVWLVGGGTLVLVVATKLVAGSFMRKGG